MRCKKGDLAIVVKTDKRFRNFIGRLVTVKRPCSIYPESWDCDPPFIINGMEASIRDCCLRPIKDQPGNEQWFTAAPRSKPATTKQDTIDARGMVRS